MVSIVTKKSLSVLSLVMINIIAIDSLRNLPINAINAYAIPLYYLVACLFFLIPCALVTAELATHYPETGGAYVWVRRAFGQRMGFVAIWLQWIYNVCWYPTILAFVAANIAYLINPHLIDNKWYMVSMVVGLFGIATLLNSFGMKTSARVSVVSAIVGTIIPMLTIITLAVAWIMQQRPLAMDVHHIGHMGHIGLSTHNMAFFVVVMFSIFGLEMSATHAGQVHHPEKNYPKALIISSIFIVLSLVLASMAIAIVVPHDTLSFVSGLDQAFNIFLSAEGLSAWLPWLIMAIIVGSFGSIAAWVIGPTKGLVAAALDNQLPPWITHHNRFHSPIAILMLQAFVVLLLCGFFIFVKSFNTAYWILSDLTAQLAVLFYIVFFAAAIRLHKTLPVKINAFKLPTSLLYLTCGAALLICCITLILGFMPPESVHIKSIFAYEAILISGIFFTIGIPFLLTRLHK